MKKTVSIKSGFTLVELSIVLVIIGLIIGGVVVGRDLIDAATIRAQISQIEKYNTAVNTFRGKYGYLPGDIPEPAATQQGFTQRGDNRGEGDGNGVLEGDGFGGGTYGTTSIAGETGMFWVDLTSANGMNLNFINGSFSSATPTFSSAFGVSGPSLGLYFPPAMLGNGNYVYIWSGGLFGSDNTNYFGLGGGNAFVTAGGCANWNPGLTVQQAYKIDNKIDDGLPQSGRVQTLYLLGCSTHQASSAVSGSASTCSDQGGSATNQLQYSVGQNKGAGTNCAISIRFQ